MKSWEEAGWKEEPRNGREWALLRDGKPEPKRTERLWKTAYRCRKVKSHKTYKTIYQHGREVRVCSTCTAAKLKRFYAKNKGKYKDWGARYRKHLKELVPVFEDGYATVPFGWIRYHGAEIPELLETGVLIVEMYGDPVFELRRYGSAHQ